MGVAKCHWKSVLQCGRQSVGSGSAASGVSEFQSTVRPWCMALFEHLFHAVAVGECAYLQLNVFPLNTQRFIGTV